MNQTRHFPTPLSWCVIGVLASTVSSGCLAEESSVKESPQIDVRCAVNLGLTPESGLLEDWAGATRSWETVVEENRITLTRRYACGDECAMTEEIVLGGLSDDCPAFVSARVTRTDAGGALGPTAKTTQAKKGTLEIEEWNPKSGVVSGRLESEVRFTFYVSRAPAR